MHGSQAHSRALPRISAARGSSEFRRLRSVVDALVRIAEHAGATASFLKEATGTVMELTRATGAVVLMAREGEPLTVASARGQMMGLPPEAYDKGQTLARACLRAQRPLHSDSAITDERIQGTARASRQLYSLIATPLPVEIPSDPAPELMRDVSVA